MLVRLLQSFSSFTLDEEGFAPEARPPREWKSCPGRKGVDKFRPALHLTMYTQVSPHDQPGWCSLLRVVFTLLFKDGMWIRAKEAI